MHRERQYPVRFLTGLLGVLMVSFAAAHHTSVAFYDPSEVVSVTGTVTASKLANPHSYYQVTTDEGEQWIFESAPSYTALQKQGWDKQTVPVGARVRMSGAPSRDGRPVARYSSILVYGERDARELFIGGRGEWAQRAREVGGECANAIDACVLLDREAVATLQEEFGDIGVWSDVDGARE